MSRTMLIMALCSAFIAGCKIPMTVSVGGSVTSASGERDCAENQTCMFEPDSGVPFSETWTASANPGYVFAGWDSKVCKYQVGPCVLNLPAQFTEFDVEFPLNAPFVQPQPMHFLYSLWGVGAAPGLSSVLYGFRQADVGALSESADSLALTNQCTVLTALLDFPDQAPPNIDVSGSCQQQSSVQLPSDGPFAFIFPPVINGPTTITEAVLPVYLTELSQQDNRISASMASAGSTNSETGFDTRSFLNTFVAERSENMTVGDLVGDWLLTRLEVMSVPGVETLYTIAGIPVNLTGGGDPNVTLQEGDQRYETEYFQFPNGAPLEERFFGLYAQDEDFSFPFSVSPDGEMSFNPPGQTLAGFVTPSADFFVLAEGNPNINDFRNGDTDTSLGDGESAAQLMVGIRPNPDPSVVGKRYRLVGVVVELQNDRVGVFRLGEKAQVVFDTNVEATWRVRNEGYKVFTANAQGLGLEPIDDVATVTFGYSVAGNGRIELDVSSIEGVDKSLITGYATLDNRVLVFGQGILQDQGETAQVGMWLGYCVNCE